MATTKQRKSKIEGQPPESYDAPIAPWPSIDRYPTVIGSNLSIAYISTVFRQAQTGYRQQYVDVLDELLEREPHGFAVLSQRILAVAGGRIECTPAQTDPGSADETRAREICDFVKAAVDAIPDLRQSLVSLLWALYYGVCAAEINWERSDLGWLPARLHFIHSRRIAYPDQSNWAVHIWDQGMVRGWETGFGNYPTEQFFGIRAEDYPGKFIVHTPQLRGDYPTRDGLGRELAYWFAIKGMTARGASQYIERFARPWPIVSYATTPNGTPRAASKEDITRGEAAARAIGTGAFQSAILPDTLKVTLSGPGESGSGRNLTHKQWIDLCNSEISKAVLTVTDMTEPGANGARASTQFRRDAAKEIAEYDAACLSDTLKRDLISWIVRLNFPGEVRLTPSVCVHVEEKPDPMQVVEVAAKAAAIGMPIDAKELAERLGLTLVDPSNPDALRLAPLKAVDLSVLDPSQQPTDTAEPVPPEDDDEQSPDDVPAVN